MLVSAKIYGKLLFFVGRTSMSEQEKKSLDNLTLNQVYEKYPNKFELTVVSKRAKQIKEGSKPLVDVAETPIIPVIAALHEVGDNAVEIYRENEETLEVLDNYDKELEKSRNVLEEDQKLLKKLKRLQKLKILIFLVITLI